ncbi:MAG: hypothetical protein AAF483_23180, partial [Planctomycetota bacterium]
FREKRLAKQVSAELKALLENKSQDFKHKTQPGKWHSLEVRIKDTTMSLSMDGKEVGSFKSEGIGHPTKRMLRLSVPKQVYVDDIQILRLE